MVSLSDADAIANIISSITTTVAAWIAALWFFRARRAQIAASLTQEIQHIAVDSRTRYVRATVRCTNKGAVALYPIWTYSSVQTIAPGAIPPRDGDEFDWPVTDTLNIRHGNDAFVIEPAEEDTWTIEFAIDSGVQAAQLYTMVWLAPSRAAADNAPHWPSDPGKRDAAQEAADRYLDAYRFWETSTLVDFTEAAA